MTFPGVSTVFAGFLGTPKQYCSFFTLWDVLSSSTAPLRTSTQSGSSLSDITSLKNYVYFWLYEGYIIMEAILKL